jgi:hypothetical protein
MVTTQQETVEKCENEREGSEIRSTERVETLQEATQASLDSTIGMDLRLTTSGSYASVTRFEY